MIDRIADPQIASNITTTEQWFMQDENVACHDLGKTVSFERAVDCFGTSHLDCVTRFRTFQFIQTQCLISTEPLHQKRKNQKRNFENEPVMLPCLHKKHLSSGKITCRKDR